MKIYIAGPMRGYPRYNFDAFDHARDLLSFCFDVVSPADMDRELGFDPDKSEATSEFIEQAMRRDIEAVLSVDALFVLKGWEQSKGTLAEIAIANWRNIPVHYEK